MWRYGGLKVSRTSVSHTPVEGEGNLYFMVRFYQHACSLLLLLIFLVVVSDLNETRRKDVDDKRGGSPGDVQPPLQRERARLLGLLRDDGGFAGPEPELLCDSRESGEGAGEERPAGRLCVLERSEGPRVRVVGREAQRKDTKRVRLEGRVRRSDEVGQEGFWEGGEEDEGELGEEREVECRRCRLVEEKVGLAQDVRQEVERTLGSSEQLRLSKLAGRHLLALLGRLLDRRVDDIGVHDAQTGVLPALGRLFGRAQLPESSMHQAGFVKAADPAGQVVGLGEGERRREVSVDQIVVLGRRVKGVGLESSGREWSASKSRWGLVEI